MGRITSFVFGALALLFSAVTAEAQSGCTYLAPRAVLTAGQWQFCFQQKQDALGFTPLTPGNLVGIAPITVTPTAGIVDIGLNFNSSLVLDGSNNLGVNLSHSNTFLAAQTIDLGSGTSEPASDAGTALAIYGADAAAARSEITAFGATPSVTVRASGGTRASPTALAASSSVPAGNFSMHGYDGSVWTTVAYAAVHFYPQVTWTSTTHATEACLATTAVTASATAVDNFCVFDNGAATLIGALTAPEVTAPASTNLVLNAPTGQGVQLAINGAAITVQQAATFLPTADNAIALGGSSNRWSTFFSVAATIPTIYGGAAAGSALNLQSTSNGSPSGDSITLTAGGLVRESILSNGNVGFGTETNPQNSTVFSKNVTTGLAPDGALAGVWSIGVDAASSGFDAFTFGTNGQNLFLRADGTAASPSAVVNSDSLGAINFFGYVSGTTYNSSVRFQAVATETFSAGHNGGYLEIDASGNAVARAQVMRLQLGVIIGTGTTDPGAGNLFVGGAGSSSAPSLAVGNATTGLYSVSTTGLGLSVNGTVELDYGITNSAQWTSAVAMGTSAVGSSSVPSLFVGNHTTGLYSVSTTGIGIAVNGVLEGDWGITNSGAWTLTSRVFMTGLTVGSGASALCINSNQLETDTSSTICGISALRYKNLIAEITPERGLIGALALHGWSYTYKATAPGHENDTMVHVSLIADDMAAMNRDCAEYSEHGVENYMDRCFEAYQVAYDKKIWEVIGRLADRLPANDDLRRDVEKLRAVR
jgi:hypothetical protein